MSYKIEDIDCSEEIKKNLRNYLTDDMLTDHIMDCLNGIYALNISVENLFAYLNDRNGTYITDDKKKLCIYSVFSEKNIQYEIRFNKIKDDLLPKIYKDETKELCCDGKLYIEGKGKLYITNSDIEIINVYEKRK